MKKIVILALCLFFTVSSSLAQDRKSNRGPGNRLSNSERTKTGNFSARQSDTRKEQPARPAPVRQPERAPAPSRPQLQSQPKVQPKSSNRNAASNVNRQSEQKRPAGNSISNINRQSVQNRPVLRSDNRQTVNINNNRSAQNAIKSNRPTSNSLISASVNNSAIVKNDNRTRTGNRNFITANYGSRGSVRNYNPLRSAAYRASYSQQSNITYRYYKPYNSHYNAPLTIRSAIGFLLFPFGSVTFRSYSYPYYRYYYPDRYYYHSYYYSPFYSHYYNPFYTGTNVYNNNYYYNTYSYENDKLIPDSSMLQSDTDQEYAEYPEENNDLEGIKLQNTRFTTANNNSYIGFVINNDSKYYISSISFKITIRTLNDSETIDGIFYKLDVPLESFGKKFCQVPLDGELQLPDSYSVFATLESITTPSGMTVDR
ncbi:MAG: hypothetical protein FWH43_01570 [Endomicrobia bacterium]|nr:hypothetical protein [Endomicrobiia bacterium]